MKQFKFLIARNKTHKSFVYVYSSIIGIIICGTLSSCRPSSFYATRYVDIQTNPNAVIFWEKNGQKIATANDNGHATIGMSEYLYRKGFKKITVAKAGYEPQTISLHNKFNGRVMLNLLFPSAFIWAHYKTINDKKLNEVFLTTRSEYDSQTYLDMANRTSSFKKQVNLLQQGIYQDPVNESGMAIIGVNMLSDLYYKKKDYEKSQFWANYGLMIDYTDENSSIKLQRALNAIREKEERKARRTERVNMGLNAATQILQTTSNIAAITSVNNTNVTTNNKTKSLGGKTIKKQNAGSASQAQSERISRKAYDDCVSQLIDMNIYRERYNDTQRRNIQSKMKAIREQYGFPKSEWEDWNGVHK